MAAPIDTDQEHSDRIIALADDIAQLLNQIKDLCDDPAILYLALKAEGAALIIEHTTRQYRPRLMQLKQIEKAGSLEPALREGAIHHRQGE